MNIVALWRIDIFNLDLVRYDFVKCFFVFLTAVVFFCNQFVILHDVLLAIVNTMDLGQISLFLQHTQEVWPLAPQLFVNLLMFNPLIDNLEYLWVKFIEVSLNYSLDARVLKVKVVLLVVFLIDEWVLCNDFGSFLNRFSVQHSID